MEGMELPMTKGISFYKVKDQKIYYVRQSPEHFVKVRVGVFFTTRLTRRTLSLTWPL